MILIGKSFLQVLLGSVDERFIVHRDGKELTFELVFEMLDVTINSQEFAVRCTIFLLRVGEGQ